MLQISMFQVHICYVHTLSFNVLYVIVVSLILYNELKKLIWKLSQKYHFRH